MSIARVKDDISAFNSKVKQFLDHREGVRGDLWNMALFSLVFIAFFIPALLSFFQHGKLTQLEGKEMLTGLYAMTTLQFCIANFVSKERLFDREKELFNTGLQVENLTSMNNQLTEAILRMDKQELSKYGIHVTVKKDGDIINSPLA